MAVTTSYAQKLNLLYNDAMQNVAKIRQLLKVKFEKDQTKHDKAWLALVQATFYKDNTSYINWKKLQKYWDMNDDKQSLSDAEFSDLQFAFLSIRSSCDYAANVIKNYCPKDQLENWLNNQNGYSKVLNMFIISFPLMVISTYPSKFRDTKLFWTELFEYGAKDRLSMFYIMSDLCKQEDIGSNFVGFRDHPAFNVISLCMYYHNL